MSEAAHGADKRVVKQDVYVDHDLTK
jgi:hypothetical protein